MQNNNPFSFGLPNFGFSNFIAQPNRNVSHQHNKVEIKQETQVDSVSVLPGADSIKIKKLREAEKEYYNRPEFDACAEISPTKKVDLNDDMLWEIGKYIGKNCGLLNVELRARWMRSGIIIKYDHVSKGIFPMYLSEYVAKIVIDSNAPTENILTNFPRLKEIHINDKMFGVFSEQLFLMLTTYKGLERIIMYKSFCHDVRWKNIAAKISTDKLYVTLDDLVIKYRDYIDMKKKLFPFDFVRKLVLGHNIDLESETKHSVMSYDLGRTYLYLNERVRSIPKKIPKITLSVVINEDILQIDYYLGVFTKLYRELGIEMELDIYGKNIQAQNNVDDFGDNSLYHRLIDNNVNNLSTILERSIDRYLASENKKKEAM